MSYTISEINSIVDGCLNTDSKDVMRITSLLIDSRQLATPNDTLFFAINGNRHDGHTYIADLYRKGIRAFVIDKTVENVEQYPEAVFISVNNVTQALQLLCATHRSRFNIPVIGVTGSNGKTVVKEWLYQLMRNDKNIVRSPKSYNSQIGVPLSVWQMNKEHELAIFEAGISQPNEMHALAEIIKPTIGIITNIGEAHEKQFIDANQKTTEKLKLFKTCETIIYCSDYETIESAIKSIEIKNKICWSKKNKSANYIIEIKKENNHTGIHAIEKNGTTHNITIPFTDDASIENAIHCWVTLLQLNYTNDTIAERMLTLTPIAMRLEMKEGINNSLIINDSYSADIGSLSIALDFLNQQKQHINKTVILSDILQSGKNEEELYAEVGHLLASKGIHRLIGIGDAIGRQATKFNINKHFYKSTDEFIKHFNTIGFSNEAILIKGARNFTFEKIAQQLQHKAHETVMEINLSAVVHNLNYFRAKLKKGVKLMAMVKASSYGSGSFEIANVLQFHHVDYLAVAYADEGVELRKAGITLPIMVMNPEEQGYEAMLDNNLEPELFSLRVLKLFIEKISTQQNSITKTIAVHLKLDTGMHRLGFTNNEIPELITLLKSNKHVFVKTIFSHLSAADNNTMDDFTNQQIQQFDSMSTLIQKELGYNINKHILNSPGISRFPNAQFDMVRLGIGLYGIGVNKEEQENLEYVNALKTTISQIKIIPAGESIGYNRAFVAPQEMRIATVPIGYADGLNRRLSNGKGILYVHDMPAPIVGNVCMDMCMIDITNIPAQEGDEVIVFNNKFTIQTFAERADTIPYEILTSVSKRVKRVYFQE